jgi:hypothetical protein
LKDLITRKFQAFFHAGTVKALTVANLPTNMLILSPQLSLDRNCDWKKEHAPVPGFRLSRLRLYDDEYLHADRRFRYQAMRRDWTPRRMDARTWSLGVPPADDCYQSLDVLHLFPQKTLLVCGILHYHRETNDGASEEIDVKLTAWLKSHFFECCSVTALRLSIREALTESSLQLAHSSGASPLSSMPRGVL